MHQGITIASISISTKGGGRLISISGRGVSTIAPRPCWETDTKYLTNILCEMIVEIR